MHNIQLQVSNLFNNLLPPTYAAANKITVISGVGCAIVATEMALRALGDLKEMFSDKPKDTTSYNFSANLGGAIFYGLCATNFIPFTPLIGLSTFVAYSIVTHHSTHFSLISAERYLCANLISKPVVFTAKEVVWPILNKLVLPALEKITTVVYNILRKIPLPRHPVWIGVALLVTGIAAIKLVPPMWAYALGREL